MLVRLETPKRVFLAEPSVSRLSGTKIGEAHVVSEDGEEATDFAVLDTFDGQIMGTGRFLAAIGSQLVLFQPSTPSLFQDGAAPGFVSQMPQGAVTTVLGQIVDPLRTLLTLVQGRVSRRNLKMVDDLEKTVARCREWWFQTETGQSAAMIEFLPVRGYDEELAQLETHVRASGDALAQSGDIARTLAGSAAQYTNKPVVSMNASDSAFDVANAFLRANLTVARQNEQGVIDDLDSEFLHDYRVALRRIRSVISLFKDVYSLEQTERLKTRFSALMAKTGRLRDLDVYMLERDRYAGLVSDDFRPGIEKLFDAVSTDRQSVHQTLTNTFQSAGYAKEVTALERLLATPKRLKKGIEADHQAFDYAQSLIWKRYRKVCKIAGTIDDQTPDEQVHELRIQCKKLRYLIEFFAPLFDESGTKAVLKSLKKLQNTLGAFNDYSVQQAELKDMLGRLDPKKTTDAIECAASVGALVTLLHQKQLEERGKVVASFAAFDAPATRDRVRKLFKPGTSVE